MTGCNQYYRERYVCLRLNRNVFLQIKFPWRKFTSGRVFQIEVCIWELSSEENRREERKRK